MHERLEERECVGKKFISERLKNTNPPTRAAVCTGRLGSSSENPLHVDPCASNLFPSSGKLSLFRSVFGGQVPNDAFQARNVLYVHTELLQEVYASLS